jgi:hypothetical protein
VPRATTPARLGDPVSEGVWERLSQVAPVAPGLVGLLSRLDQLGLSELEARLEACHGQLRAWAARPENHGRPAREGPCHLERLALGTLLERRLWWE